MVMSCENCECCDCVQEREDDDRRVELEAMFKSWSWNSSPAQVARDIKDGWDRHEHKHILDEMEKFGFSKSNVSAVEDVLEIL
jgi:hypothetical protein